MFVLWYSFFLYSFYFHQFSNSFRIPEVEMCFSDKSIPFKKALWNVFPFHSSQKGVFLLNLWFPWRFFTSKGTKNYVQGKIQRSVRVCLLLCFYLCEVFTRPWDVGGFGQFKLHQALHSFGINVGVFPDLKKYHRLLNSSCSKCFFRPTESQHYIYHLFFMLMDCNGNFYEALFMFGSSWVIRFHTNLWGPCQLSPGSVIKAKWRQKKY